jgi:inner membrane protein
MPTILTHAVVGAGLAWLVSRGGLAADRRPGAASEGHGAVLSGTRRRRLLAGLSAALAVLPDADVLGSELGVPWGSVWSHRGVSHSLTAAVVAGAAIAFGVSRSRPGSRTRLAAYFALVTASHGVLDASTNGGVGVAFLAPFRADRYFFPWRPIEVSPLGLAFFSQRGVDVLQSEIGWVWVPLGVALGAAALVRRFHGFRGSDAPGASTDRVS